jgi:hypothetical protein
MPKMTLDEALAVVCVYGKLGYPNPAARRLLGEANKKISESAELVLKRFEAEWAANGGKL